jgi:hypothetical protein
LYASGSKILRRIFRPNREEVTGGWIKLHIEELHNLYSTPNIIRAIKSRRMILVDHAARTGDITVYKIVLRKSEGRR